MSVSQRRAERAARERLPALDKAVFAGREQGLAVWAIRNEPDKIVVMTFGAEPNQLVAPAGQIPTRDAFESAVFGIGRELQRPRKQQETTSGFSLFGHADRLIEHRAGGQPLDFETS